MRSAARNCSGAARPSPGTAIATDIATIFGRSAVALYDRRTDTISRGGPDDLPDVEGTLRAVARQGIVLQHTSGAIITAIRLGGAPIGSLALSGEPLSDTVVQSIANLAAIALERAEGQQVMAQAEAARRSGELRATLLDAVAHEFKTPLTSIKAAATGLGDRLPASGMERELTTIIGEESDRLEALVSDATQMLRLESGDFRLHLAEHRVSDLVTASFGELAARLDGRQVRNLVPPGLSLPVDADLLRVALRHLADNAVKYSPAGSHDHRQRVGVGRRCRDRGRERRRAHPGRRAIGDLHTLLSRKRGPQRPRQRHGAGHRPADRARTRRRCVAADY